MIWIVSEDTIDLISPNRRAIRGEVESRFSEGGSESLDDRSERLIRRTAIRCGFLGAVTSVGGLFTVLIGLPIDVLFAARLEARLIYMLAALHDVDVDDPRMEDAMYQLLAGNLPATPESLSLRPVAGMVQDGVAEEAVANAADFALSRAAKPAHQRIQRRAGKRLVVRGVPRLVSKLVPFAGGALGLAFNWYSANKTGALTLEWLRDVDFAGESGAQRRLQV